MRTIPTNLFSIANNYIGVKEINGLMHNPLIVAMHKSVAAWVNDDETPWCSAFVNWVCWQLRPHIPMSNSLAARSWLRIGNPIPLSAAEPGFDVVILSRGPLPQPDASTLSAPGHVGFYVGMSKTQGMIQVLGGNQNDQVSIADYPASRVLGVRRLY